MSGMNVYEIANKAAKGKSYSGFDMTNFQIIDNSKLVLEATEKQILSALIIMGETAEGYAKAKCPVDTGRLRNSIAHSVNKSEKSVYIGTNVEYAPYVEFGTGQRAEKEMGGNQTFLGQESQPYLRPALADHVEEYKNIATTELSK